MEFNFLVPGCQQGPGIAVWDAAAIVRLSSVEFHKLRVVLEEWGQRSAAAQGLRAPISDIGRLRSAEQQQLYLHTAPAGGSGSSVVLGGLKVGRKKLFMHRANGAIVEVEPLCVLDFYVAEEHQRQGLGKALFEHMLEAEQLAPEQLGYDRPSAKLLAFLRRHYGLAHFIPQSNNFVLFEGYYFANPPCSTSSRAGSRRGSGSLSSSGSCWGAGALASLGNGRQTLHVLGTRMGAAGGCCPPPPAGEAWVPTSVRPPTPSLQHCVHLASPEPPGSGGSSPTAITLPSAWSPVGGPGCPTAGRPTQRDVWDAPPPPAHQQQQQSSAQPAWQQQQQQQQQQQSAVQYVRGEGIRALAPTRRQPAGDAANSHASYQQQLLAAAANPAPRQGRSTLSSSCPWALQQDDEGAAGRGASRRRVHGAGGLRDSLDSFGAAAAPQALLGGSSQFSRSGSAAQHLQQPHASSYAPVPPYNTSPSERWSSWPDGLSGSLQADGGERVGLRRQAAQAHAQHQQEQQQQQLAEWRTTGAGPPGQLMAAPVSSYAVPTAGMAGAASFAATQQQQRDKLCLSWSGLMPPRMTRSSAGGGGGGGGSSSSSSPSSDLRAAAASHRAGSGAASCLRMV